MKIVSLQAENVKRLVAVEIRPDGNMVEITGKNGQGKTSVLDSIWWALAGTSNIQSDPIRRGQEQAKIRLDLGEMVVTRTFRSRDDGAPVTNSLTVENAEGARFTSPQSMLDGLLGSLTFDPLGFSRLQPRDQFNALKVFVPGINFDSLELENKSDFMKRTDINRRAKEARTRADAITVEAGLMEPVDEQALVKKMGEAASHNTDIQTRIGRRIAATEQAAAKRALIVKLTAEAEDLEKKIAEAPALPDLIDTDVLGSEIEAARKTNEQVRQRIQKQNAKAEAAKFETEAKALTDAMTARDKVKLDTIAAATLPVEGIGFGDGIVTLNGVPFDQGSDAEQLRASIAIAMALNPKLHVIRVRDGSLLDETSLELLRKMADEKDYQVWIERVDSSGKVGFVIEDGHVKALS